MGNLAGQMAGQMGGGGNNLYIEKNANKPQAKEPQGNLNDILNLLNNPGMSTNLGNSVKKQATTLKGILNSFSTDKKPQMGNDK